MIGADHTKVMRKHKIPLEYDNFCLSIMTKKRTLDLRVDDQKTIQVWYEKIKSIIASNSESKIKKENRLQEFNKVKRSALKEAIEEIWKNEILLNWQSYWDPIKKCLKPAKVILNFDEKEM